MTGEIKDKIIVVSGICHLCEKRDKLIAVSIDESDEDGAVEVMFCGKCLDTMKEAYDSQEPHSWHRIQHYE